MHNVLVSNNSLWPSDAICWHKSGSILAQVMAWCPMAQSHYLNQSWLVINDSPFHTPTGSMHGSVHGLFGFTNRRFDWLTCVDCDMPTQLLLRIQINTGNTVRQQKSMEFLAFFRGRGQSYARRHRMWNSLDYWDSVEWCYNNPDQMC